MLGVSSLTAITPPFPFRNLMKAGRLPSTGVTQLLRYCAPLRLLARLAQSSAPPYTEPSRPSPATGEISRVTQRSFPHMPSRRPRRVHLLFFGYLADDSDLPHLTTGSALSVNKLRGSMGSLVVRPASLRSFRVESFLDPLSPESRPSKPDLR